MTRTINMVRKLPLRYQNYALDGITDDPTFAEVNAYIEQLDENLKNGYGLFLSGSNGVGKTGALAAIFNYLPNVRPSWGAKQRMWCRARDIATTYGYWFQDEMFDEPVDALYNAAKFLVVDELGREQDVKNFAQRMHSLLSVRRDNLLVTCFTTNISMEDVRKVYGAGFYSILHETCFVCSAEGPDRRIQ